MKQKIIKVEQVANIFLLVVVNLEYRLNHCSLKVIMMIVHSFESHKSKAICSYSQLTIEWSEDEQNIFFVGFDGDTKVVERKSVKRQARFPPY